MTEKKDLTFAQKLIAIQSELKAPKGQFNKFGGYKYRSCEDILEAVKPLLAKYGCYLTLHDDIATFGDGDNVRFYVKAIAYISDGTEVTSTTAFARESLTKKGQDDSQITGTASSYARKYALNGLFCIDDTKDADTDEYTKQTKAVINDEIPHQDYKLLSEAEFILAAEKCASVNDLQALLNTQKGNPELKRLAEIATLRKQAIMGGANVDL